MKTGKIEVHQGYKAPDLSGVKERERLRERNSEATREEKTREPDE